MSTEENSFEKWTLALGVMALGMWLRPFVAVSLWKAHLVPMGAPTVGLWWMFWATTSVSILLGLTSPSDKSLSAMIIQDLVHKVFLLVLWAALT